MLKGSWMRMPKANIPWAIWAMHYWIHSSCLLVHSFALASNFFSLVCHFFSLNLASFCWLDSSNSNCSLEDISVGGWKLEEEEDPRDLECDPLIGREALCRFIGQPRLLATVETLLDQVSAPPLTYPIAVLRGWCGTHHSSVT